MESTSNDSWTNQPCNKFETCNIGGIQDNILKVLEKPGASVKRIKAFSQIHFQSHREEDNFISQPFSIAEHRVIIQNIK